MSAKVLSASRTGGVTKIQNTPISGETVLSEGMASSEGVAVIDEDKIYYIPKTSPDLKTTITKLVSVLSQLKTALDETVTALTETATAFTTVDAKPVGGTGSAPAPAVAGNVANITAAHGQITTAAAQIDTIRGELNTLKDNLK